MAKRFTMTYNEFLTSFEDNGVKMAHEEIVHMLNGLYEENTSLKHENQKLRVTLTKIEREFQERGILNEEEIKRLLDD